MQFISALLVLVLAIAVCHAHFYGGPRFARGRFMRRYLPFGAGFGNYYYGGGDDGGYYGLGGIYGDDLYELDYPRRAGAQTY